MYKLIDDNIYFLALYIWIGLAVLIFPLLLKITVPYGRHSESKKWGPMLNSKFGWFVMEIVVLIVFSLLFFSGTVVKTLPLYIIYGAFVLHYLNRTFIFPFQIRSNGKKMPLLIIVFGICFNIFNGFFNGYWFGWLTEIYSLNWLQDPRFIIGTGLFLLGMMINITSDQKLFRLRKNRRKEYSIPNGGLFKYISSPNLFGEIIEWTGWAIMGWSLPGFSFLIWTLANLLPRALDHHRWYKQNFSNYPMERKAIIPKIL